MRYQASVLLCTRNRSDRLRHALAALEAQDTQQSWQLVVVDNGSTDGTPALLAEFAARTPLDFSTAVEPRAGLANARNAALGLAEGHHLLFIDDDCYAAPDFVEAWLQVFSTTDLDYAAGRIELHAAEDAPITIRTQTSPQRLAPGALLAPGFLQGANMACRREVVDAVGRFDPLFGAGSAYVSAEDLDYFQRAANLGFRGGFEPGPLVRHHHGRSWADFPALARSYDIGYGAALLKASLTDPRAFLRSYSGHEPSWLRQFYWDLRARRLGPRLRRWRYMAQGALHFAWNASLGRHRGYW